MPEIGSFTGLQGGTIGMDTRVVVSGEQLSAPSTHCWGRVVTACTSRTTLAQQNRDTVDAFRAALTTRYGQEVSELTFDQELAAVRSTHAPLTARIIARVDVLAKTAELERALTPAHGKLAASAVATALRAANPAGPLTPAQVLQANTDAATVVATQRTAAQTRITQLQVATGNLYGADAGLQGRVQTALAQVVPTCAHRQAIYAPVLENALARLDASMGLVDHAGAPVLLGRIAQQLADKLDHLALCGVVHHACNLNGDSGPPLGRATPSGSYTTMMTNLNNGGVGLENLSATHPATLSQLCTLGDQLVTCIGEIGTRFHADMAALGGGDVGTRFAGQPATGLTNIRLTDSDPHKGGHRVAILTMADAAGHETPVVYKPRDVRIDAKLVGAHNDAAVGASLAEYTEQRIADHRAAHGVPPNTLPLPTYTFMPRVDGHGDHYGYVQCLSHDTDGDRLMDVAQARDYHRNLGRQIAMLSFAGARDLHHTNMMVSGRQPCFTDLELSFEPDVFRLLEPGTGNSASALSKMQVGMAVFSHTQLEWLAPATVVGDALTLAADYHPPMPVTENLFHVRGAFEDGAAIDGNNRREARTFSRFGVDVDAGFKEVIAAFTTAAATPLGRADFDALIDGFDGMHARYHPVGTPVHLASVKQRREYAGPEISTAVMTARMQSAAVSALQEKDRGQDKKPAQFVDPVMLLQPHHEADWAIGDVPYFVRPLGTDDCLHNGRTAVGDPARNGHYFGVDPLQQSKDMFARLGDGTGEQAGMLTAMADDLVRRMDSHRLRG